jgi:flagellar assembly protein FliH
VPPIALPTAEEVERIYQQARDEGYAAGRKEGYDAGYAEGQTAGYAEGKARGDQEAARLTALGVSFAAALDSLEQQMAGDLLSLALTMTKQMLRETLRIKPEALLPAVQEAMGGLLPNAGHPTLTLHPDDAALVREHLASDLAQLPWRIVEDGKMERGGCRVESDSGEVDATLESRWKSLNEALGRDDNWNG